MLPAHPTRNISARASKRTSERAKERTSLRTQVWRMRIGCARGCVCVCKCMCARARAFVDLFMCESICAGARRPLPTCSQFLRLLFSTHGKREREGQCFGMKPRCIRASRHVRCIPRCIQSDRIGQQKSINPSTGDALNENDLQPATVRTQHKHTTIHSHILSTM